ncbi:ATP-dependent helicase [Candidatus Saccharibacteria bacterium]|nr:ATP-dependent helicase [Candidatus Saccharibacteria bacterium]
MDFEQAYAKLNEQQRAAVDHIDGPLLVIAGPGTGKTQLLSVRVANILKQTDATPDNILCLTFTEAAASNMRHRLADFIGPEAYKVQIHTYHSFGSYLLQEHRPDLTNSIDELDRFQMIRKIQSQLKITSPLRGDWATKEIISAISDLKAAALDANDIAKIIERNEKDNEAILVAIKDDLAEASKLRYPANVPYYEKILETLKGFVHEDDHITDRVEPIANIYYRSLAQILLERDEDTSIATPLREWRNKYFEKDGDDAFIFKDIAATLKLADLAFILRHYSEELAANGLYDYDDMILMAIDLLKKDDEKRFNAQERFQYILLDEYQDTNDAQSQLVALLTDNPSNEGRPNIMAVGDDDQAIYGFQGANTSNFFDFDAKYHPTHILLNQNYRSSAEILELAHNVIEQGEDRFCKAPNVNIDKRIIAANPPETTELSYREFKTYQAEYSHVAKEIRGLLDKGVKGSQIAIIAPKHKMLTSILPYLHSLDILVSYEKRENILDVPKIDSVLTFCEFLLKLVKDPRYTDEYAFHIFSLDVWGIEPKEMLELITDARKNRRAIINEMLAEGRAEHLQAAANFCIELAGKVGAHSAEYFLDQIALKVFPDINDYDFYSNLNTLRECVAVRDGKKESLASFIARIQAYRAAEIQILDRSPYHEAEDAVVLQTVHSAKGLEYDYVYTIAADNDNWGNAKGNNDRLALPRNLEYVRHTGDSLDEKLRVFFVAITRAKKFLSLSYSLSDFNDHHRDRLRFLDTVEQDGEVISRAMPEKFAKIIPSTSDEIEPKDISSEYWFDKYVPNDEVRKNLYRPKVEHFRLFPTQLNTFIDIKYAGPLAFFQGYIVGIRGESNFAIDYGNCVHEVMDRLNKEQLSNDDAYKLFQELADQCDVEEDEKRDLLDRGAAELPGFLKEFGDKFRSVKTDSEHSFFSENIVLDDILLGGKIDRIEINEADKTITVSDFKTTKPAFKWSDKDSTLKHKLQLYFYKFLIENSREYTGYRVTKGRIDFVSPDNSGYYHALELEFKDDEAATIKQLIKVVYKHIKDLDFPDTTGFKESPIAFINSLLEY